MFDICPYIKYIRQLYLGSSYISCLWADTLCVYTEVFIVFVCLQMDEYDMYNTVMVVLKLIEDATRNNENYNNRTYLHDQAVNKTFKCTRNED